MNDRTHYRDLYEGPAQDGRPLGVVHGNCQAEALRVVLMTAPSLPVQLVRVPPVHLLGAADLPAYDRLLGQCAVLLSQPVADGYRGLPLGTREVAVRCAPGAVVLRWPVVRWQGLHPFQAIVRAPDGAEPPVVPYHDLRTLTGLEPCDADLVGAWQMSLAELARREQAGADVAVSDLLVTMGVEAAHTLNHPGNPLLVALARRLQDALGYPADAVDPGRVLLGGIRAPVESPALAALGLRAGQPRPDWTVAGATLPAEAVARAQAAWYATRPDVVAAGRARHAERLSVLGLG